jgi:hypothetical protein
MRRLDFCDLSFAAFAASREKWVAVDVSSADWPIATMPGTGFAFAMDVLRRVTAFLAMIAIIGLLLLLIWQVELHHEHGSATDEPATLVVLHHLAA